MPFFRANAGTLYAYCSEDIVDVLPFFSETFVLFARFQSCMESGTDYTSDDYYSSMIDSSTVEHAIASKGF